MKKLLTVIALIFGTLVSNAQTWSPVGNGLPNADITALTVYSGYLIAAGYVPTPYNNIAAWDGVNWNTLGTGINDINGMVYVVVYNGNLIAAGQFSMAGGGPANNIAMWNGTNWSALGNGIDLDNGNSQVNALCVFNGNLIVSGYFDSAGGKPANNVAQWNGTNWSVLDKGMDGGVTALQVYNNNLYAGGQFDTAGGIAAKNIAQWNGSAWSALGNGVDGDITALAVYDSALIVGGIFYDTISTWNGVSWSRIGIIANNNLIRSMGIYNNNFIVGGTITGIDSMVVNDVAQWNGSGWDSLGAGLSVGPVNEGIQSLVEYNGLLFAGGYIWTYDATYIGIEQWGGAPTRINELQANNAELKIYPNPSTGVFNFQASAINQQWSIEVYNTLGQKVASSNSSQGGAMNFLPSGGSGWAINLSGQPAGVYLYRITDKHGELVQSGKLEIQ
jgi:hypothetical protein